MEWENNNRSPQGKRGIGVGQVGRSPDSRASFALTLSRSYIFGVPPCPPASASTRSARLGLRATPEQETVLRRAAEVAHKSLTDFILDAAYQAA